jgi:hypothetical protein
MTYMSRSFWFTFLGAFGVFLLLSCLIIYKASKINGGLWVYPLDDTYIHMSIAKNFAQHGIWGMTSHGFTNTSSGPLFTLVLSLFYGFWGVSDYWPLVLNLLAGLAGCLLLSWQVQQFKLPMLGACVSAMAVVLLIPMAGMAVMGMEHAWHCVWALAFVWSFRNLIFEKKSFLLTLLLAILGPAIRYESLFLVAAACLMLLLNKSWWQAIVLGLLAWLFPVLFGLYSISLGWNFLPNSILMKIGTIEPLSLWPFGKSPMVSIWKLYGIPEAFPLLFLIGLGLYFSSRKADRLWLFFPIAAMMLHLHFANVGTAYRYESYLFVLLSIPALEVFSRYHQQWWEVLKSKWLLLLVPLSLFLSPMLARMVKGHTIQIKSSNNIFSQQIQMTRFAETYYKGSSIVLNDIGAVSYYTDPILTDLVGLADVEVSRLVKSGQNQDSKWTEYITAARKPDLIMIYDSWFYNQIPESWVKVAEHRLERNFICGDDEVSFYATDGIKAAKLRAQLKAFQPKLEGAGQMIFVYPN